jgi:hypothetical protein
MFYPDYDYSVLMHEVLKSKNFPRKTLKAWGYGKYTEDFGIPSEPTGWDVETAAKDIYWDKYGIDLDDEEYEDVDYNEPESSQDAFGSKTQEEV